MTPILHFNMMKRRSRAGLLVSLGLLGLILLSGELDSAAARWSAFAATCAAITFAIYQIPGSSRVMVDAEGISIRSPFWRQRLDWRNIKRFVLVDLSGGDPELSGRRSWIGYLMNERQLAAMPEENVKLFEPLGCHGLLPPMDKVDPQMMVRLLNGAIRSHRVGGEL
jgi:hypothetical protein